MAVSKSITTEKAHHHVLSARTVKTLNEELHDVRQLHVPREASLGRLHGVLRGIDLDYRTAFATGEVTPKIPSLSDVLIDEAMKLQAKLERQARFGRASLSFMDKIGDVIATRRDGTTSAGSINPLHTSNSDPGHIYMGDDPELQRLYLTSGAVTGRVVGTMFRPEHEISLGVWVWPSEAQRRPYSFVNATQPVDLLQSSVKFVQHVIGCELPDPITYSPQRQASAV
jgi:hypothetical protein